MKILILGASGFIGNACFDFFSQQNTATGVDLLNLHGKDLIIDSDGNATKELLRNNHFDVVLNCAGSANIKQSFTDPQKDFEMNTGFVENILSVLKERAGGTKFISISSAAVYGNPVKLPVKETDPANPLSPYGSHKLLSEQLMADYFKLFKIPSLSLRIFSAYGDGLRQQFFFDLFNKFKSNKESIELFGTGNESRDFIFISDIVKSIDLLIQKGEFDGGAYNVGSGEESFIDQSALLFAELNNYNGQIVFNKVQLNGYPLNWRADIGRLKRLGFTPKINLREGLKSYVNWLTNKYPA